MAAFRDFQKKTTKRTWLCVGISPVLYGLRTWSKGKRRGKSSSLHSKKIFCLGVSDVISGGLLGHLGPLCLVLGANR